MPATVIFARPHKLHPITAIAAKVSQVQLPGLAPSDVGEGIVAEVTLGGAVAVCDFPIEIVAGESVMLIELSALSIAVLSSLGFAAGKVIGCLVVSECVSRSSQNDTEGSL
jgi:hypothetical protein